MLAWLLSVSGFVCAHGYFPPKHGGLMSEGGEISMELVTQAARTVLYVEDHGTPVPTAGATGAVALGTIGSTQQVLALVGDGDNRLVGPPLRLSAGDRVVARAELPDGNVVFVRFRVPQPGEAVSTAAGQALPGLTGPSVAPFARPFAPPFALPMARPLPDRAQPSSPVPQQPQSTECVP
ncbi:hypothetical protein [Aquincola tertiaricarbonis]|uniref:hypothetical protein n=1 Tax=Aquincola tertiaricarbonis TaxID=391953 RepID=UPI0012ED4AA6|nr:hypothetical protein [Aquincola tertiaricarbonis]